MNLNASPETVHAVAEALALASLLDDRVAKADQARLAAWSEKVETHRLTRDDLLDSVQAFYDRPSNRPIGIGDLIEHARAIKRDRLDREVDVHREAWRNAADTEVEGLHDVLVDAITARIGTLRTERLTASEIGLQTCHGRYESMAAISEYTAAKREAQGLRRAR